MVQSSFIWFQKRYARAETKKTGLQFCGHFDTLVCVQMCKKYIDNITPPFTGGAFWSPGEATVMGAPPDRLQGWAPEAL